MSAGQKYVRASDIARLTGVSIRTVRRWIANEIISSSKFGGATLVARTELERLLSPASDPIQDSADEATESVENQN